MNFIPSFFIRAQKGTEGKGKKLEKNKKKKSGRNRGGKEKAAFGIGRERLLLREIRNCAKKARKKGAAEFRDVRYSSRSDAFASLHIRLSDAVRSSQESGGNLVARFPAATLNDLRARDSRPIAPSLSLAHPKHKMHARLHSSPNFFAQEEE